ncbi:MAG: diguanylate cyclase [Candidatus Scalinduaceae bacterium]
MQFIIISENDDLRLLKYSLSRVPGCNVRMLDSVFVTLLELKENPADLIILDTKGMESSSNEILDVIHQRTPGSQIIVISDYSNSKIYKPNSNNTMLGDSGIINSFSRPFVFDELLGTITRYIRNKSISYESKQKVKLKNDNIELKTNPTLTLAKETGFCSNGMTWQKNGNDNYIEKLLKTMNNMEELSDIIVQACAARVKSEKCSLMLLDRKSQTLTVTKATGINVNKIKNTKVKLGESVAGLVALKGETFLVTDTKNKREDFDISNSYRYKSSSFISIPLKVKSDTIGVLNLTDKINNQHFTENDLNSLSTFASYAAIAIRNNLLFNELQDLSVIDELTGLYNKRHFLSCLENEIERSCRYNCHFALAIFGIDDFKYYNDTYGRSIGNFVLNQISDIIKIYTRNSDIVARYGEGEFAALFPETRGTENSLTSTISGLQFPDRLRTAVESHGFSRIDPLKRVCITISGGVAIFPLDGKTKKELISRAEENLCYAKKKGKNTIYIGRVYPHDYHIKILRGKPYYTPLCKKV